MTCQAQVVVAAKVNQGFTLNLQHRVAPRCHMGSVAVEKLLVPLIELSLENGIHTIHTGLAGSVE